MATGQTKLSIFNVPVCWWERVREREESETSQTFPLSLSLPLPFLDELSMLWSNQYAEARFKVGITVSSLQTHELAFSDTEIRCLLSVSPCVVIGNMNMHLNPVWLQVLREVQILRKAQMDLLLQMHGISCSIAELYFNWKCWVWIAIIFLKSTAVQTYCMSNKQQDCVFKTIMHQHKFLTCQVAFAADDYDSMKWIGLFLLLSSWFYW